MIKKLTEEMDTKRTHKFFTESDFFVNFQFSSIVCFFGRFFFPCQILNKFFLLHCQLRSPVFLTLSDYIFCVIPLVYSICTVLLEIFLYLLLDWHFMQMDHLYLCLYNLSLSLPDYLNFSEWYCIFQLQTPVQMKVS